MAAAAFVKDLLYRIPRRFVAAEEKINDILSNLHNIAMRQLGCAGELTQVQTDNAKKRLFEEAKVRNQFFRLTTDGSDATYEWYRNRVEKRVEATCLWFLRHRYFQT
ncbi:Ankyrin repeat A protein 2 [Metarhizium acridum]|uniref:Ankyrin repeat A protein 2 n=1 Tax=Metarhizium acridum TaxID=92637 RepID=UPI001C6C7286|nr:Ankyrin repeat A protein 2 [Metarhizium acridum]